MTNFKRLYAANMVNAFGSWLTFLAIALLTQEKYGSQYVAVVFLMQTIPAIIFSQGLARLIPAGRHEQVFLITQILLALNSLVLVFNQSLPVIFAHLLAASFLRSISGPILNSLVGKWVPKESLHEVFTRLGALQSGTLAFAPMAGAWLKVTTSASVLFVVDAVSFMVAVALMKELFLPASGERHFQFEWRSLLAKFSPQPRGLTPQTRQALFIWFVFLVVGAILNAIEFPGFEVFQLSERQIGYAIGAWGVGNLLAFIFPLRLTYRQSAVLYLGALTLFVWAGNVIGVIAAFLMAGSFSSYFSGGMRAHLQSTVGAGENSAPMWAYASQVTQLINLIAYGGAGLLLASVGFYYFAYAMLGTAALLVMVCWRA